MEKALIVVGILLFLYFGLKKLEVKSFGTRNKLEFENIYEFEGFRMNYRTLGEGAPVVLLHGSMYSPPWDGFENKLAEHFKVYTPDMPGFGGSEPIDGHVHNTDLFADAFCEFIKSEELQESPIISLSLGTVVSAN